MRKRRRRAAKRFLILVTALLALALAAVLLIMNQGDSRKPGNSGKQNNGNPQTLSAQNAGGELIGGGDITPDITPTPAPTPDMPTPAAVEGTRPSDFGYETKLEVGGKIISGFERKEKINFGPAQSYTALEGVTTLRNNNYRNGSSSYGTADVKKKKLKKVWEKSTATLGRWTGSGWTGQPLIVKWPEETRKLMNISDEKKSKKDLVEVIYPMMDGHAYFYDLDDGAQTRKPLRVDVYQSSGKGFDKDHMGGFTIDPRGYPILYVGSGGDDTPGKDAGSRQCIFSLIDQKLLYEFGKRDKFAPRPWDGWDCAPLVDPKSDTIIVCGEDGVIYTFKLNSRFDPRAGTVSVDPSDPVRLAYTTARSREFGNTEKKMGSKYWLGMESSGVIWKSFLYIADNGGNLMCVDLDTMKVVWVQDTLDDTNCSPVFVQEKDGKGYIYISTSFHGGWRAKADETAPIPIWKIDAATGEIVWSRSYDCYTSSGVSGGVQATVLLGQGNISGLAIVPVAKTPKRSGGILVALDRKTGEEVWRFDMKTEEGGNGGYAWSSTTAVYDEDGTAYLIQCNTDGNMFLLDGKTGELLDKLSLWDTSDPKNRATIESTPAAFGNMIVVGTRGQKVYGVKIE